MAAANMKQEVHCSSPGPLKLAVPPMDSAGRKPGIPAAGEKSTGLKMAEDRRAKEGNGSNSGFQSLMEYREAPASPSASSVTTTLSLDNCGSPDTPNSPPPTHDGQEMDAERLPNELLDELCEDIGMKEGMELDFVEFLMEQDMVDPQQYMTPEALRSSGFNMSASSSKVNSTLNTPTNKASSESGSGTSRNCGSPSAYSVASSTNVTMATSGSSSPVSKRFHQSNSGPPSPPVLGHHIGGQGHVFKAPQTPPMPRRPVPQQQQQQQMTSIPQRSFSPRNTPSGASSPQLPHSTTGASAFNKPPPQYGQFPGQGQNNAAKTPSNQPYHRLGRPVPPNVNIQNVQQQQPNKFMSQQAGSQSSTGMGNQPQSQSCAMMNSNNVGNMNMQGQGQGQNSQCANSGNLMNNSGSVGNINAQGQGPNSQFKRPVDSPLDGGYFTASDTLSTRSFDSIPSTIQSSMPGNVPNSMHMMNGQHKMHMTSTPQKSVHFAEGMNGSGNYNQRQNEGLPYEPCYRTNVPDCELEEYRMSIQKMQSKMMPRLPHHGKMETAPYTVPGATGQMPMSPFDYTNTSAASGMTNMQQFDYQSKCSMNGSGMGMDNNQNLVMPNYNENMHSQHHHHQQQQQQQQQQGMANMNCQMSAASCEAPMGSMQQQQQQQPPQMGPPMPQGQMGPLGPGQGQVDGFRGQSQCQMQDPSKAPGGMYDSMHMMKNSQQALNENNCQFSGQSQGNMGENYGMMGMNQGMMGNQNMTHNQQTNQNFNGANFQGMPPHSQGGFPGGQRSMQINMPSAASTGNGMMGYDPQFEQNRANMSGNMNNMANMDNSMFSQQQQQTATPNMTGDNMGWSGPVQQGPPAHQMTPQHQGSSAPINIPGQQGQGQCGQLSGVPCAIPNCANCKTGSPNRPPMMSSQQRFIQHLITDRSNAFRSHPLFPLLRDLIIADMNFSTPNFPYQLIQNLPADFDRLLQNFLHRNPPAGNYQTNFAVESVVMDALKYAHQCLIEKIRQRQDQDGDKHKSTSKSLSAIEEFCEKFDQSVRKSYIKPATLQIGSGVGPTGNGTMGNGMAAGPMLPQDMGTPSKDPKFGMGMQNMMMASGMFMSPQAKKGLEFGMMSPNFKSLTDFDSASDCGSLVSSSSHPNKPESKKHPSLPKEAVAIMLDWLRQHKDNPYPNDDEKAMLIKQTGLTINQINYWFTNARRRILPKWAQQCKS